eukprot:scaffold37466_cov19-Prasinocladus_malaysianus.AAC.1
MKHQLLVLRTNLNYGISNKAQYSIIGYAKRRHSLLNVHTTFSDKSDNEGGPYYLRPANVLDGNETPKAGVRLSRRGGGRARGAGRGESHITDAMESNPTTSIPFHSALTSVFLNAFAASGKHPTADSVQDDGETK